MSAARLSNIDGLRAIAALSVFVQHFIGDASRAEGVSAGVLYPWLSFSEHSLDLGRFGVVLFFLISGFVVPFSIRGEAPLKRFAISRFFRLYPAFWVALACLAIIYWTAGTPVSMMTMLANVTMAPQFLGQGWMSGIYWTLFIELVFYFLAAGLFATRFLGNPLAVVILAVALVSSTAGPILVRLYLGIGLPVSYIGLHLSFLFSGLLLRLAIVERKKGAASCAAYLIAYQLLAVLAVSEFSLMRNDGFILIGTLPIMTGYLLAVAVFIGAVRLNAPQSRVLAWIGRISYSIYLFHWIVNVTIYRFLPLTGGWRDLATMLVCLMATIGVSYLVFRFVEKPSIALGRRVASKLLETDTRPIVPEAA